MPEHKFSPKQLDLIAMSMIVMACATLFSITSHYVFWAWDQGNILFPAGAISHGLLPNIDFRSGYLGLGFLLESALSRAVPVDNLLISQFLFCAYTAGIGILVYKILVPLVAKISALSSALACIVIHYQWPTNSPGILLTLTALLGFYLYSRKGNHVYVVIALGIVVGIGFLVKQTAVFEFIAFLFLLSINSRSNISRFLVYFAAALSVVLPLWRGGLSYRGQFVLIPIILAIAYCFSQQHKFNYNLRFKHLVGFAIAFSFTVASGLYAIYGKLTNMICALNEALVRVPLLIDRDKSKDISAKVFIGMMLIIGLFALFNTKASAVMVKRFYSRTVAMVAALGLCLVIYMGFHFMRISLVTDWVYGAVVLMFSPGIASCFLISILLLFKFKPEIGLGSAANGYVELLLFICILLAAQVPFTSKISFAPALVIPLFIYLDLMDRIVSHRVGYRIVGPIAFCMVLIALGVTYSRINSVPVMNSTVGPKKFKVPEAQIPFIETAQWLATNTSASDRILGYPNFALSFFLADRFNVGFQPNFIGNHNDFLKIQSELKSQSRPKYLVVSMNNYPYEKGNLYFFEFSEFGSKIFDDYHKIHSITIQGKEVVSIYKLQPGFTSL